MTFKTKMEVFMKNELILSSLILTAQITPAAMADSAIQKELKEGVQESKITTPFFKMIHPFSGQEIEVSAVITLVKSDSQMSDMNFGKITHNISFKFLDRANQEIKDFEVDESDEGGFYVELRGASKGSKSYTLWSCSSTMNCGYDAPGFMHIYEPEIKTDPYYYVFNLPVVSYQDNSNAKHERLHLYFNMPKKFIR